MNVRLERESPETSTGWADRGVMALASFLNANDVSASEGYQIINFLNTAGEYIGGGNGAPYWRLTREG